MRRTRTSSGASSTTCSSDFDRKYLEALLEAHDNNISAAARAAGIERMSIYKMIRRLGLDKTEAREGDDDSEESTDHQR